MASIQDKRFWAGVDGVDGVPNIFYSVVEGFLLTYNGPCRLGRDRHAGNCSIRTPCLDPPSSFSSSSPPFRRLGELDEALGPCQEATHPKVKSCRYKEVVEYGHPRPSSL